ncbi:Gfo/Idh/MocA family protein [Fodinicola feengrottensis]|uniref:Gfo/Idh/MocA family protein n=1 Tax=Fodinicola feengrottensis TaxID=435914 RepID=UPI0024412826|nr:Gfo/Idh/MocA family oxidoreductase [Fodinicola feengrottensis]
MLRFGVLGCASIARRRMLPALADAAGIEVTAVASRDLRRAQETAAPYGCASVEGYDNLLARDDVDAVYLPLPTGLHAEWIEKALLAGKHVLSEKALTVRLEEAQSLVALAQAHGLLLVENFAFLHHSQHAVVRESLPRIGEIRAFSAAMGIPPLEPENPRYLPDLGGGGRSWT